MQLWNNNPFITVPKVFNMLLILTDLTKFCWVLCDWSFQVLGVITMDKGIRSSKSLSLGMPKVPQGNILRKTQVSNLGDSPEGIPSFVSIHWYVTWSYIFIHHMIWVLLGASFSLVFFSFTQSLFAGHTHLRETQNHHDLLEYSLCFTYIFWAKELLYYFTYLYS